MFYLSAQHEPRGTEPMTVPKVLAADFHRNGVGGEPFFVAIVDDPENGRMLVVDFGTDAEDWNDNNWGHVAVLDLDKATEGNIYMFPTDGQPGGNAWRGDRLGSMYRPLIKAAWKKRHP
jgi:hypothetical protein